jgi:hypothetical protein
MSSEIEASLPGNWVHSHEEDSGNQMVFRPSTHPLPPSRGRSGYRLEKGGALHVVRPGPTDKREFSDGSWSLEEGGILVLRPAGGEALRFQVVSVNPERLVLNRP